MAVFGTDALAVWHEGDAIDFAVRSVGMWSAPAAVPSALGDTPAVAAAADGFDLVWSGFSATSGSFEVYFAHYAGGTWSLPVNVSNTPGESLEPALAVADGQRLVVWSEVDDAGSVIYGATSGNGDAWTLGPLPEATGYAPAVVAAPGAWFVAWIDDVGGAAPAMVMSMARTGGGSWSTPEVISDTPDEASDPALAVAGSDVGLVWREGDDRVAFARSSTGAWSEPVTVDAGGDGVTRGAPALAGSPAGFTAVWAAGASVQLAFNPGDAWTELPPPHTFGAEARGVAAATVGSGTLVLASGRDAGQPLDVYSLGVIEPHAPPTETPTETALTSTSTPEASSPAPSETPAPGTPPGGTPTASAEPPTATPTTHAETPTQPVETTTVYLPATHR